MQIEQHKWTGEHGWEPALSQTVTVNAQLVLLFGNPGVFTGLQYWDELQQAYPNACFLGCSTAGEIYQTQVLDQALVATAIQFEHSQVQGWAIELAVDESSFAAGDRLGQCIHSGGLRHVFVLSDGLQVNGSELVRGILPHLPPGVTITGGLSGDDARFQETFVLWNGAPRSGQIVALGLYGDRLQVGYGSFGGWRPFGSDRVITKSRGNVLYELDGEPALTLYKKYLGEYATGLPATGLLFPLSLRIDAGDRRLVRTILSIDEAEQSLTFAGDLPEGAVAQLMQASFEHLVEGATQAAEISQQALQGGIPELAILISCVGRKLLLRQQIEEEVEGVQTVLGSGSVLTGFYSYGEISPFAPGAPCELHNQTMTITTFAEV